MKTRAKKIVIGVTNCMCCGKEIPAKQNELGTLDVSCQWCDMPVYAKAGTEAHTRLMKRVSLLPVPVFEPVTARPSDSGRPENVPAAPPMDIPQTEPKPVARAARSFFDLTAGAR